MNDENEPSGHAPLIEDEPRFEEADALDAFVSAPPAAVKSGVGWGVVLPLFLLAGLGGAVGGWALTQYVMPNYVALPTPPPMAAKVNLEPLTARIEAAEKKLSAQSSQLSFLSSEIKSGTASVTVGGVDKTLDITPLLSRLSEMEARLETAEQTALGDAIPVSNEDGEAVTAKAYLEIIENRLLVLEKTRAEINGSGTIGSGEAEVFNDDYIAALESLRVRVSQLETDIEAANALAATPLIVRDTVLLPPFPRAALLDAMTAPRDAAGQGWVSKTLKKHISVRNPQEVAQAEETLSEIEALAAKQNYAAALALLDDMPSDVRSLAGEWTRAVKAEVNNSAMKTP